MVSQDKTFQQHMNLTLGITASSICPSKPASPAYTMPAAKGQIQDLLPVRFGLLRPLQGRDLCRVGTNDIAHAQAKDPQDSRDLSFLDSLACSSRIVVRCLCVGIVFLCTLDLRRDFDCQTTQFFHAPDSAPGVGRALCSQSFVRVRPCSAEQLTVERRAMAMIISRSRSTSCMGLFVAGSAARRLAPLKNNCGVREHAADLRRGLAPGSVQLSGLSRAEF